MKFVLGLHTVSPSDLSLFAFLSPSLLIDQQYHASTTFTYQCQALHSVNHNDNRIFTSRILNIHCWSVFYMITMLGILG